jgi:hypothetical protein
MSHNKPRYHEGPFSADMERRGSLIRNDWRPNQRTIDRITALGFNKYAISSDLRIRFILTMRERDTRNGDWDSLFEQFAELGLPPAMENLPAYSPEQPQTTASTRRNSMMSDEWQPSAEMLELIVSTLCQNIEYIEAQLLSFTSHFHGQQHPNWDQKFKQWINNGWNVYGHKKNYGNSHAGQSNASGQGGKSFVEKHTDKSWREGL